MSLQVTTLEQLKAVRNTEIVSLGAFDDGTELIVEMKRPRLFNIMMSGNLPNSLLATAQEMYKGKAGDVLKKAGESEEDLKSLMGLFTEISRECLVNPTYEQIEECVPGGLNDSQLWNVFGYMQKGFKDLDRFHKNGQSDVDNKPVDTVSKKA